jgi:Matrixin
MHRKIVIPALLLSLLCACIDDTKYLMTSLNDSAVARDEASMPAARYTSHAATATATEIIPVRVTGPFTPYDRAKILRAVNEWNVALNGFARFDILPDGAPAVAGKSHAAPWMIVAVQGNKARAASGAATALAHTYGDPTSGGLMTVYLDRLGKRDLGGVVLHELGHALGLGHDNGGGLMAARYHPSSQQCVDKSAAQAVAAKRALPVGQLNWCRPG